jgi:hypothetical protein
MIDRITLADTKRAGLCLEGVKKFIVASGMDFKDFARNGIPVEQAKRTDGWEALVDHVLSVKGDARGQEE